MFIDKGRTDGAGPNPGYIGEVLNFTSRTVTVSAGTAWYGNATKLVTLTAGSWLIFGNGTLDATRVFSTAISTNGNNDNSGFIAGGTQASAIAGSNVAAQPIAVYNTTGIDIYAKAYIFGASGSVAVSGFAVRIA